MLTRWFTAAIVCAPLASCDTTGPGAIPAIPDPPAGFLKFVAIDAGGSSVCGITADSLTYCWGGPRIDGEDFSTAPKLITAVPKIGTISVGTHQEVNAHAMLCGTIATTEVVCYGSAAGAGNIATVPGSAGFTNVAVGGGICALAPDATARCWTYTSRIDQLGIAPGGTIVHGTPVTVAGNRQYQSLSVGGLTTCGVTTGGDVYCWGNNFALQIPDAPASLIVSEPTRVTLPVAASRVSTLELHMCALTSGALEAYCWGMSARGRLGQTAPATVECPNVTDINTEQPARCIAEPIAVSGTPAFVAIAAGTHHTCALDAVGQAYCWGSGTWGEIGNGRMGVSNWKATPAAVAGVLRFRSITAGQFFTCGIATNDATYCWGSNGAGQLGVNESYGFVATVPHPIALPQ